MSVEMGWRSWAAVSAETGWWGWTALFRLRYNVTASIQVGEISYWTFGQCMGLAVFHFDAASWLGHHLEFTSISRRFYLEPTSMSPQASIDLAATSVRCHLEFTLVSLQSCVASLRFHLDVMFDFIST